MSIRVCLKCLIAPLLSIYLQGFLFVLFYKISVFVCLLFFAFWRNIWCMLWRICKKGIHQLRRTPSNTYYSITLAPYIKALSLFKCYIAITIRFISSALVFGKTWAYKSIVIAKLLCPNIVFSV